MKEITQFANVVGTPSGLHNALDSVGSSQDVIFAEAIMAMEPTTILEEAGIILVQSTPNPHDELAFPIMRNTQLTWRDIDGRVGTNALGSDLGASALNRVEYKKVRPTVKTANIFLPDQVSLLNKINFDLYTQVIATDAKRKKEADALAVLTDEAQLQHIYAAGGFTAAGAVAAGSTLDFTDILSARTLLRTGSDPVSPDFVLVHFEQYEQLNQHPSLAPGATSPGAIMRKVGFDQNGDVMRFSGMDIYATELIPAVVGSPTTDYLANGHPVVVGKKGWAIGRGEKQGITIHTEDSRRRHGQWKIIDMAYDHTILVQESLVLIRAAD